VEIWYVESLADLAEQWLDEGVYGEVPDNLRNYLDTEAMGRDLGFDGYTEASIAGTNLVYTIR
jgi:antirestriction protein